MSLSRKPDAPARSAPNTYSSSSNVVSTTMRVPAARGRAVIRRVASRPSMRGIRMSISTTSGRARRASSTASAPSAASPTTSMSGCGVQQRAEAGADQRLVVGEQDARHERARARASGSVASTRQPPSAPGPACSVPPSASARSRMPRTPAPAPAPCVPGRPRRRRRRRSSACRRRRAATTLTARAFAWRRTLVSASCTIR